MVVVVVVVVVEEVEVLGEPGLVVVVLLDADLADPVGAPPVPPVHAVTTPSASVAAPTVSTRRAGAGRAVTEGPYPNALAGSNA